MPSMWNSNHTMQFGPVSEPNGPPTVRLPRWSAAPAQHLLRNRFYLGEIVYRGEVHAGEHEPIIDRDLFEAVQAKRAANAVACNVRSVSRAIF
jgi:site-specific DNA recombinase